MSTVRVRPGTLQRKSLQVKHLQGLFVKKLSKGRILGAADYVPLLDITNQSLQVLDLQGLDNYKLFEERVMLGLRLPYFSCFPSAKAFPTAWPRLM